MGLNVTPIVEVRGNCLRGAINNKWFFPYEPIWPDRAPITMSELKKLIEDMQGIVEIMEASCVADNLVADPDPKMNDMNSLLYHRSVRSTWVTHTDPVEPDDPDAL